MRLLLAAALAAAGCAATRPEDRATVPLRACLEWERPAPQAERAAQGLFASFTRLAEGPYGDCDAVARVEKFSDGQWLSRMSVAVSSPCGKKLGRYSFRYGRDGWERKLVEGLHRRLRRDKDAALAAARECDAKPR